MDRQLDKALKKIVQEVTEGVYHGFFSITIDITTIQSGTRRVVIRCGKSNKFEITEEELKQALESRLKNER
jgi:hypothetical protein